MNAATFTRSVRVVALVAALAVAVVVVLAALFVLSDSRMASDDYALAARGRSEGVFGVVQAMYTHWSGRWALFLLAVGGLVSVDPFEHYPWLLLGVWSVFACGLAALVRTALGAAAPKSAVGVAATLLFALGFTRLPVAAAAETFYWFTGGVPYLASVGLAFLVLARTCRSHANTGARGHVGVAATALAAALAAGLQEVVALVLVVALSAVFVHALLERRENLRTIAVVWASAAASFVAVVLAPGNTRRAAREFPGGSGVGDTLLNVATAYRGLVGDALTSPSFVAACVVAAFFARRATALSRTARIASVSTAIALPLVALGAALHVTGGWIAPRMSGSIALFFDVGVLAAVVALTRGRTGNARAAWLEPVALLVLAAALPLDGNGRRALAESVDGRAARYAAGLDRLLAEARRAAAGGTAHIELPAPPSRPRLFVHQGLSDDPEYWANRRLAELLGATSLTAHW
jgi:hypothetical protein